MNYSESDIIILLARIEACQSIEKVREEVNSCYRILSAGYALAENNSEDSDQDEVIDSEDSDQDEVIDSESCVLLDQLNLCNSRDEARQVIADHCEELGVGLDSFQLSREQLEVFSDLK